MPSSETSIFYISRINLLSKKAHVHNIVKTCEALAIVKDIKITLVNCYGNFKKSKAKDDFLKEHSIKQEFPIITLDSFGIYFKKGQIKIINWLEVTLANFSLIRFLLKKRREVDIIYFRDQHLFLAIIFGKYLLKKLTFFEVHAGKKRKYNQFFINLMVKISDGVISITFALKKYYQKLNKNIAVVFCIATERENFPYHKSKKDLRVELNLPIDKFIVGYVGKLGSTGHLKFYEVDKIVRALEFLPKEVFFVAIGGQDDKSIKYLKNLAKQIGAYNRIKIYSWMPRFKIPAYLLSFDVLTVAKPGELPGDSPAKMFEYLAVGKPIVACATEPILEVMHDRKNCLVVNSNSPKEWAEKIREIYDNKLLQDELVKQAKEDSKIYTWENRGKLILDFIKKSLF